MSKIPPTTWFPWEIGVLLPKKQLLEEVALFLEIRLLQSVLEAWTRFQEGLIEQARENTKTHKRRERHHQQERSEERVAKRRHLDLAASYRNLSLPI